MTEVDGLAYLLKHDTVYGLYEKDVTVGDKTLVVAGRSVKVLGEKDPANLPWAALGVDVEYMRLAGSRDHDGVGNRRRAHCLDGRFLGAEASAHQAADAEIGKNEPQDGGCDDERSVHGRKLSWEGWAFR